MHDRNIYALFEHLLRIWTKPATSYINNMASICKNTYDFFFIKCWRYDRNVM